MARLRKGSPAAKAWGRRMRRLRGRGKKRKAATRSRRRAPKVTVGGIAYEPVSARKRRAGGTKRRAKKKRRGRRTTNLPYGYGYP